MLSLVLISSALSSCHTSRHSYEAMYENTNPTDTGTVHEHWQRAYEKDSTGAGCDSSYYYYPNDPVVDYRVPLSFYAGPYRYYSPVQRKGFGYYGYRHSVSA